MDWFHCNQCFRKDGSHFFVTSCGHIFCKKCMTLEKCAVCGSPCKHLALSDNLKPQEKKFFRSPVETALQCFNHISQVWCFQKKQTDLLIAFYKDKITKLDAAVKEAQQTVASQNMLTTPRPVGITSPSQPVAPRPSSQHSSQVVSRSSSMESIPCTVGSIGNVGQGSRGLQERSTPRDSYTETPSPASTHSLSYRPSSASSGQGVPFRSFLSGNSGHTRVFTPSNSDILPTEADGINQERRMEHLQIEVPLPGLPCAWCSQMCCSPVPLEDRSLEHVLLCGLFS
ncbi:RING finger protein 212B isoform X3 [Meriones unguiculatus]|uniref:RING finger protein 212B isoform X3 n=1 Tax=Meriones unguiculatus TaxID=10047 RepID=UPI00293E9E50|nr:RING finger protein 212B isoform X3 [Meriones unguiculatus]